MPVGFWRGWQGPEAWRFGALSPAQAAVWQSHDRSPATLAALEWQIVLDAFDAAAMPSDAIHALTYEALCADPIGAVGRIADFADLPVTPGFTKAVAAVPIEPANDKLRRQLTPEQQQQVEATLAPTLARFGYR